jgi:RNA polymerase sigma-70 factor, ECF subfamily
MSPSEFDSFATRDLLRRVREGEADATDDLLREHRDWLRRVVLARLDPRLRARLDASDVVQEACLVAARRLHEYLEAPRLRFRLWLRGLALEQAVMAWRRHVDAERRSMKREESLDLPGGAWLLPARDPTPSRAESGREREERLRGEVDQLKPTDREILLLRYFEGLSNQEAADVLGIEPGAASKRHRRALQEFGRRLRKIDPEGLAP